MGHLALNAVTDFCKIYSEEEHRRAREMTTEELAQLGLDYTNNWIQNQAMENNNSTQKSAMSVERLKSERKLAIAKAEYAYSKCYGEDHPYWTALMTKKAML